MSLLLDVANGSKNEPDYQDYILDEPVILLRRIENRFDEGGIDVTKPLIKVKSAEWQERNPSGHNWCFHPISAKNNVIQWVMSGCKNIKKIKKIAHLPIVVLKAIIRAESMVRQNTPPWPYFLLATNVRVMLEHGKVI